MSKIKFYKNVEWLRPYVQSTEWLVPTDKLKLVRGYYVRDGLTERAYGSISKINSRNYEINILLKTEHHLTYETVLSSLAHELAHLVHWEHTPGHFWLQSEIMKRFVRVMRKNGIKDHSFRVRLVP